MTENNRTFLVTRKTLPSLKLTCYKQILSELSKAGHLQYCRHNKTDRILTNDRGNYMAFLSVDDPEKIKSTEWNDIWMEEANEFTWDDYMILSTRMSAGGKRVNQMFLSLNPDENSWVHDKVEKMENVQLIHSTYKDNPFLSKQYVGQLEGLKDLDESYYQIYALGNYSKRTGIIYHNYDIIESIPENLDEVIYGLDFGFNNPSVLVFCGYKDKEVFLDERIYETLSLIHI